jgi:N-formylmaleamate deformylase
MRRPSLFLFAVLSLLAGCATAPKAGPAAPAAPAAAPFHVERTGQGRSLLFIPGLSSSGEVWNETVQHLRGQYDCHVLTLPGFAGQPSIPAPFLPTMRRAVADYIRQQHLEKPILIGHSLGGVLALAVAADAPELVGGVMVVDSLPFLPATMDPSATADSVRPFAEQMRTSLRMQTAEQRAEQAQRALRSMITDEHNVEAALRWSRDSDPETVAQVYYEMSTTDLRPELPRITVPTLVLGSWIALKGRVAREQVEQVYRGQYAGLAQARVVMSDTARHFIMLDDPQGFQRELDGFLSTQAAPVAQVAPRR